MRSNLNNDKRFIVLGAGESGVGTAILAKKHGYDVFVSDHGVVRDHYRKTLAEFDISWEENTHTLSKILNADIVMKSPGIPDKISIITKIKEKNIPIISEIEFASKYTSARIIGITGSNGKTTTTMLTHHILKNAGLAVNMGGNIGDSFARQVAIHDQPYYVLEISSFQLDGTVDFVPHIAVLTNISEDHLDRYDYNFQNYVASKFKIAANQKSNDYFIYDQDDETIKGYLKENPVKSKAIPFSLNQKLNNGVYLENNNIIINIDNSEISMSTKNLIIEGNHNKKNAMAASAVAHLLKIRKDTIRESLEHFHGVEHRLEHVLKINNVKYINDSKATNVNAVFYALDAMKSDTVWIAGGVDKGNDYSQLYSLVNEKVKAIICLGIDNTKIIDAFKNCVDVIIETSSMKEAVNHAYTLAEHYDNVLLSPACASFDLFKNYEDRGRQFKDAVREL